MWGTIEKFWRPNLELCEARERLNSTGEGTICQQCFDAPTGTWG